MDPRWGLLVLHKPVGPTSHGATRRAQRALGASRAGHAGTLDPMASGVLLVALGRATRLLEYLVGHDKAYRARIRLGVETDTLDREGRTVSTRPVPPLGRDVLEQALDRFRGTVVQRPPAFSAVKVDGVPLHRRARRGEAVEAPLRTVEIRSLDLVEWSSPELVVDLVCSKGTYVRSLARDLGEELGTGATLWELERTRSGPFGLDQAVPLEVVVAEGESAWRRVLPAETLVQDLPRVRLDQPEVDALTGGRALAWDGVPGTHAVLDPSGRLSAVAVAEGSALRPTKVFHREP